MLKQDKITFAHGKTVNMYIVCEINLLDHRYEVYLCLDSLFEAVKLVKNADIYKYKYSGYGIRFDVRETFSVANGFGKSVTILAVDMSSSVHVDDKKKDILILDEGPTQGLDDTSLTALTVKKRIQLISLRLEINFV